MKKIVFSDLLKQNTPLSYTNRISCEDAGGVDFFGSNIWLSLLQSVIGFSGYQLMLVTLCIWRSPVYTTLPYCGVFILLAI